jgi:TonB family protein
MRWCWLVVVLAASFARAQGDASPSSVEEGQLFGNTYRSLYFGFEMKMPEGWKVRYHGGLNPLLTADPFGGIVLAQAQPATGASDGPEMISVSAIAIPETLGTEQAAEFLREHLQNKQGLQGPTAITINSREFVRFDFQTRQVFGVGEQAITTQRHTALLITRAHDYFIGFSFTTVAHEELPKLLSVSETIRSWSETRPPPMRVRIAQGVVAGRAFHQPRPNYPDDARERGITGAVVLRAVIGADGRIKDLQVVSGNPALADAAMRAVRKWRYKPYSLDGKPVEVETQITVNFTLGR